eukprot:NODE_264_length_12431_cov_0.389556.p3 type:complete len:286 gc:universal NODE_264_length_12431_cov_0.389556:1437-2294(+)
MERSVELSLHIVDLSGILTLNPINPCHMTQVQVYLEGTYNLLVSRRKHEKCTAKKVTFVIEEQTLWKTESLPDYARAEGDFLKGEKSWPFLFVQNARLATIKTKYFTITYHIRAQIRTSSLIFNTIESVESVILKPNHDAELIKFSQFSHMIGPFTVSLDSRVLNNPIQLMIEYDSDFKYSLSVKLIQLFQFQTETSWERKKKVLCQGKLDCVSACGINISLPKCMEWSHNGKVKNFKWNKKTDILPTNTHHQNEYGSVDHYFEVLIKGKHKEIHQLVVPILLIK